ncbi:MAG: hypothetical protein ABI200_00775 [Gaiellales bacterium]
MAEIFLDRDEARIAFSALERVGALRGDYVFPITRISSAWVSEDPFAAVRGIRAPGTGLPRVIALGTWRSGTYGRTLAAAYRGQPALVLELEGDYFQRIVISDEHAIRLASVLAT